MAANRRRWLVRSATAAALALLLATGALAWVLSTALVRPPRRMISESARPVLGVVLREAGDEGGVLVVRAVPPASAAGVRAGDRIATIDERSVATPLEVTERLEGLAAGTVVAVGLLRERDGVVEALAVSIAVEVRPLSPFDSGLAYEEVAFVNPRGMTLRGWYVPPPADSPAAAAVAYGHGNGNDRRHWLGVAWEVRRAGLGQLLLDFAGRGESDGETITLGANESADLDAALDFLAARPEIDPRRLALAGRSMGGAAAVLCASRRDDVRALVLDSPFADLGRVTDEIIASYGLPPRVLRPLAFALAARRAGYDPWKLRPLESMRAVEAPVLLFHGDRDDLVPIGHGRDLAAAAGGPVSFVTLEGFGHNTPRERDYAERIAAFLAEHTAASPELP